MKNGEQVAERRASVEEEAGRLDEGTEMYHDLDVWKLAYRLTLEVYRATGRLPEEERFGLAQQVRRAAVGIVANLAEGQGRGSRREFTHFCTMARGSQKEMQALLALSRDLGYLGVQDWRRLDQGYRRVGQMLNRLITRLRTRTARH
jgi:four helix bundle protein